MDIRSEKVKNHKIFLGIFEFLIFIFKQNQCFIKVCKKRETFFSSSLEKQKKDIH